MSISTSHNIALWNELAETRNCTFPLLEICTMIKFEESHSVLDYGCGQGRLVTELLGRGLRDVWGIDAAAKMCDKAKCLCPRANILLGDATDFNYPMLYRRFDVVTVIGVLSSIHPREARLAVLRECRLLLRPTGRIAIGDFGSADRDSYASRYIENIGEEKVFRTAEGLLIHHFSAEELQELLIRSGFAVRARSTVPARTIHGNLVLAHTLVAQ